MPNLLLDAKLPLDVWMPMLSGVSAKLYERDIEAWERFEPERKRFEETLSYLDGEGELDLRVTTAVEAIEILSRWSPPRAAAWRSVATEAGRVLSRELSAIFVPGDTGAR